MTTLETDTIAVLTRVRDSVGDVAAQWGEAKLMLDRLCRREFYGGWPSRDITALVRKIDAGDKTGGFGGVGTQGCRDITGLLMQIRDGAAPEPPLDHVANANARLSLIGISVGKHVIQDDNSTEYVYNGDAEAVQIIGAGTEAANGYYTKRGTFDGKGIYVLIGQATVTPFANDNPSVVCSDGAGWRITDNGGGRLYTSSDNVASPWLVTTWLEVGGSAPAPTTAHIASKNALTTCAFVSGAGTTAANGIYTERPALGNPVAGRKVYNLLGQPDDIANSAIYPGDPTKWTITNASGTALYLSTDDVQYPWLVTTWTPTDIFGDVAPTVVSKTQGELDAGVLITGAGTSDANDVFLTSGNNQARNSFTGIAHTLSLQYETSHLSGWNFNAGDPQSTDDTAFPWEASFNDSATVAEDLIACNENWEPLP